MNRQEPSQKPFDCSIAQTKSIAGMVAKKATSAFPGGKCGEAKKPGKTEPATEHNKHYRTLGRA